MSAFAIFAIVIAILLIPIMLLIFKGSSQSRDTEDSIFIETIDPETRTVTFKNAKGDVATVRYFSKETIQKFEEAKRIRREQEFS